MDEVRWGIIGCGDVTEVKSGPAFNKIKGSVLAAVMRRDAVKAADYAKRHGVPKWYADADQLINDRDVNAVYVATPPGTHALYTLKALAAGKPVYAEKPMARSYAECGAMVKAARANNLPLFVAYYRRTLPGFLKVKELIGGGAIRRPRTVNIRLYQAPAPGKAGRDLPWRLRPEIAGGGLFYDLASHQLDWLDFIFGPVTEAKGMARNLAGLYPAEDTVAAVLAFENNVTGSGSWCFCASPENDCDRIEINGESGRIVFSFFGFDPIVLENGAGKMEFRNERPEHVQQSLIEQVVAELLGRGHSPSTGISAMRTNRVMEEIVKDYYENF